MNEPTILTERLILAPFKREDAADVFAYAANPNVLRFTSWLPHRSIADSEAFIDRVLSRGAKNQTWAIRLHKTGPVMGKIEFGLINDTSAEIHYALAEPLWNRGLMIEAARAVRKCGLMNYPSITRIATRAMSANVGSLRVMEKCESKFEKVRMDRFTKFPEPVEQRQYVLMRQDASSCA